MTLTIIAAATITTLNIVKGNIVVFDGVLLPMVELIELSNDMNKPTEVMASNDWSGNCYDTRG